MSRPRLSIIPAGAIFDRSLEPRDLQVIGLLGCHIDKAGWCRRSQVKMAAQLGCGRASVQRSLERLVDAGWVEKKRPPWSNEAGQPSNSYMYRVVLDRDDWESQSNDDPDGDDDDSHAESSSEGEGVPTGGQGGAQPGGHPGAQPCVGTGAHTYVGTKNDPLERPLIERERDARARDRNAKFIAAFEQRWPSAFADDRHRIAYAAAALSEPQQKAALDGVGPFLDHLQRLGRKTIPAGWRYLEERRWELLTQAEATPVAKVHPGDSAEAKAIKALHDLVGRGEAFRKIFRRAGDGSVSFPRAVTSQLLALASVPDESAWVDLTHQQAGAWEGFVKPFFDERAVRRHFRVGSRAPWPWPPKVNGELCSIATGPPVPPDVDDRDLADFR
ncbi:helix-turn-helix domain-containing protein [Bradyrhizobium sp. SZCCHNR1070]|uniref:helix-turn-helix domain-containing protein n=1 Tax=Bradyrhizobium sp. SZCCHNR1070 TaxID=3057361 RepID=UPI002916CA9C|nr:helix-turn-helix domain-containing protein [Bradyrhizobium sp. SZCCHNR1070]